MWNDPDSCFAQLWPTVSLITAPDHMAFVKTIPMSPLGCQRGLPPFITCGKTNKISPFVLPQRILERCCHKIAAKILDTTMKFECHKDGTWDLLSSAQRTATSDEQAEKNLKNSPSESTWLIPFNGYDTLTFYQLPPFTLLHICIRNHKRKRRRRGGGGGGGRGGGGGGKNIWSFSLPPQTLGSGRLVWRTPFFERSYYR